jgi:hypothetical protein
MKLIDNYKKLGRKEFTKKFKDGIMKIPPEELVKIEIRGYIGSILGTILAGLLFVFVYERMWAISIIMFFNVLIQGSQLISKIQQLNAMKHFNIEQLSNIFGEEEEDENEDKGDEQFNGNEIEHIESRLQDKEN